MATNERGITVQRQYIGARYVPKFFQGPDGTPAWVGNIPYEALTIVTYLGNSYTSKIPVPPGIGNPSLNPTYWALTGNFNAQLQEISAEVEAIKEYVDNISLNVHTASSMENMLGINGVPGDIVILKSYYEGANEGFSFYQLQANKPTGFYVALNNGVYAGLLNKTVTPEMFGAKGNGITSDTDAFNTALKFYNHIICNQNKTYLLKIAENNPVLRPEYPSDSNYMLFIFNDNTVIENGQFIIDTQNNFQYVFANATSHDGYHGLTIKNSIFTYNGSMTSDQDVTGNRRLVIRSLLGENTINLINDTFLWSGENVIYAANLKDSNITNNHFKYVGGNNDNTAVALYVKENVTITGNLFDANKSVKDTDYTTQQFLSFCGIEIHSTGYASVHDNTFIGLITGIDVVELYDNVTTEKQGTIELYNNSYINCFRAIELWSTNGKLANVFIHDETYETDISVFNNMWSGIAYWITQCGFIVTRHETNANFGKMENINIYHNKMKITGNWIATPQFNWDTAIDVSFETASSGITIEDNLIENFKCPVIHVGQRTTAPSITGHCEIIGNIVSFVGADNLQNINTIIYPGITSVITIDQNSFTYKGTGSLCGICTQGIRIPFNEPYKGKNNIVNFWATELIHETKINPDIYYAGDIKTLTSTIMVCYNPGKQAGKQAEITSQLGINAPELNVYKNGDGFLIPAIAGFVGGYYNNIDNNPSPGNTPSLDPQFRSVTLA